MKNCKKCKHSSNSNINIVGKRYCKKLNRLVEDNYFCNDENYKRKKK